MNSKELRQEFEEADKYIDDDYLVNEKLDILMKAMCELLDRSETGKENKYDQCAWHEGMTDGFACSNCGVGFFNKELL